MTTHGTNPKSILSKQSAHGHSATHRGKTQHPLTSQKGASHAAGQRAGKGTKGKVGPPRPAGKPVAHSATKSPLRSSGRKTLPGHPTPHATKKPLNAGRPGSRIVRPPSRSVTGTSAKKPVARPASNRPTRKPVAQHAPHSTLKKHPPSKPINHGTKHVTKPSTHLTSKIPLARPAARPAPNRHSSNHPVGKPVAHVARPTSRLAVKPAHHSNTNHGKVPTSRGKPQSSAKRPPRPLPKPARPAVKGRKQ